MSKVEKVVQRPVPALVMFLAEDPPSPERFAFLQASDISAGEPIPAADGGWTLAINHPQWGTGAILCKGDSLKPPPAAMIKLDPGLTASEQRDALQCRSGLLLLLNPAGSNVLTQRKNALRFMRAVMDRDGVVAVDSLANKLWSRAALDDELMHDAEPDVEALYMIHAVTDKDHHCYWAHTHGLAEIGFFDFDILNPSKDLFGTARDVFRAAAYAIVLGKWWPGKENCPLIHPGGTVAAIDIARFMKKTDGATRNLRTAAEQHALNRVVLCNPPPKTKLARMVSKYLPAKVLSSPIKSDTIILFPAEANQLMSDRATLTYGLLRVAAAELAEFGFPVAVKLAYSIDGGDPGKREHLWFSVNQTRSDGIDATLQSVPRNIARMHKGDRDLHDPDTLSDWGIFTPAGVISPRNTTPLRKIREDRERFREYAREKNARQGHAPAASKCHGDITAVAARRPFWARRLGR